MCVRFWRCFVLIEGDVDTFSVLDFDACSVLAGTIFFCSAFTACVVVVTALDDTFIFANCPALSADATSALADCVVTILAPVVTSPNAKLALNCSHFHSCMLQS